MTITVNIDPFWFVFWTVLILSVLVAEAAWQIWSFRQIWQARRLAYRPRSESKR